MKIIAFLCAMALAGGARADDSADRAAKLVEAITLEEKLSIVHGYFPPLAKPETPIAMIPSAGHVPGVPRLGIPAMRESDASLGVANQIEQRRGDVATALPASLATAASFDPAIAYAGGAMIGAEARAKTFNMLLAGGVNLTRDPWGGRNFEYLGEDPLLSGIMAGEHIRGVQSNHILSTVKHFVLNAQETGRAILDARIDRAALRESDLLAFEIAIERGAPGAVMCAYNRVNGAYACEHGWLLNGVLKRDWGYPGFVMSDWGAVHSTIKAAMNGLDQESGQELDQEIFFGKPFAAAVRAGRIPLARLDDMVKRILNGMVATGLLDDPAPDAPVPIDYAAHADIAQRAAEAGMVLLKNSDNILPLAATAQRIVLIGGEADVGVLSGGGSSQVRSVGGAPVEIPLTEGPAASFARRTWHASSPLKAIIAAYPQAEVSYVDGRDRAAAAEAAKGADLVLLFATEWRTEAEDVESLSLPDGQDALIAAVAAANPRLAVVLETGGPVLMPWLDQVPAVIEAWYPGQRGGEALAAVLSGAVNPSGRLPITFPREAAQAPRPAPTGIAAAKTATPFPVDYVEGADVGYRWYALKGEKPLFPFGYGLSYTNFAYSGLKVEGGRHLKLRFTVSNTGKRRGADVPQLYVKATSAAGTQTWRLAGFRRVTLEPGRSTQVTMDVDPRVIARFDEAGPGWKLDGGSYPVVIGRFAGDVRLTASATLAPMEIKP